MLQIRKKILNYVIYDNNQEISRKLILNARFVHKDWLSTTTELLQKCDDPQLIEVTPHANDSTYVADNLNGKGKSFEQFNRLFGATARQKESFLPFKLRLESDFFRHENYQNLSDCFTRLGNELLDLEIIYPLDGGNMPVNFSPIHFPILRKLSFQFSDDACKPIGGDTEVPSNFADNKFGLWLFQSILNATENLQELAIPFTDNDVVPVTFEFLRLPPTIVFLELETKLKSKTLEAFFRRNQLQNLKQLSLQLHEKPLENGLMYKILEQFRETLINFHVSGLSSTRRRIPSTILRFPVMKNLDFVNIYSTECELDVEQLTCLQECLPNLDRLNLLYQSEVMLKKWVEKSRFQSVTTLTVSTINEFLSEEQDNYYRSPTLETMTQLTLAFPNVNMLTLHLNIGVLNGLGRLFSNMLKVQYLNIRLHGRFQVNSTDLVDSTLTGLSLRLVGALKEDNLDVLESVLVLKSGSQASIRNLSGKIFGFLVCVV